VEIVGVTFEPLPHMVEYAIKRLIQEIF